MMKRLLAMVLVLALTVSNLPVAALAEEFSGAEEATEATAETTVEETVKEEAAEEDTEAPVENYGIAVASDGLYSPAFTFHTGYPCSSANQITEFEADPDGENVFYLQYYPDPWVETGWAETAPGTFVANDSDKCYAELVAESAYMSVYKITLNQLGNEQVGYMGADDVWNFIVWHDGIVYWDQGGTIMQDQFNGAGILYISNGDAGNTSTTVTLYPNDESNPSYLTCAWLQNDGEKWYVPEYTEETAFRVEPGREIHMIFFLNYWTGDSYAQMPVCVEADGDLNLELIGAENAAEGQEYGEYFYRISTDTWDQEIEVTATDDGGNTYGTVYGFTDRNELGIYTSTEMSNDTYLVGPFVYDIPKSGDNEIYVGFDSDYWTVTGFYNDYNWCAMIDTDNPNVKRLHFNGDTERLLAQGYDDYFAIKVEATDENGNYCEFYVNFTVTPNLETMPHDPYLSYGWLSNQGEGWYSESDPVNDYFNNMPGIEYPRVFVLNTWDEELQAYVKTPVIPENDHGLIIEQMHPDVIAPDQELADGFAWVYNPGIWDVEIPLYVTLEDGTQVGGITVGTSRETVCAYNSPDMSNDTFITEVVLDYTSDENCFYLGFSGNDWWSPDGAPYVDFEMYIPYFTYERVTDDVYKVTVTREYLEQLARWGGEDTCGMFMWNVKNENGETSWWGFPYGLHFVLDPATVPHDPYLSYTWLDNWGEGWFIGEDPWYSEKGASFNLAPGSEGCHVYFLNTWDEEQMAYVRTPVIPQNDDGLILEPIDSREILDGQEYADYFLRLSNPGIWGEGFELYVTLEDGTRVSGLTVASVRDAICFYNSTELSNDTYISQFLADYNSEENCFYLALDSDQIMPNGEPYMEEYAMQWFSMEKLSDTLYKVIVNRETVELMADSHGGFGFHITWPVQNIFGDTFDYGRGISVWVDPETVPHDPYLSFGWLNNYGEGFFETEWNQNEGFNICPGDEFFVIFYRNVWDEELGEFVSTPVAPSAISSEGALKITRLSSNDILEGQENAEYFVNVAANADAFGNTVLVSAQYDGEKIGFEITVDAHRIAFYNAPEISCESYNVQNFLEIKPFEENVIYLGLNDNDGEWIMKEIHLAEEHQGLADIQQVADDLWKITLTQAAIDRSMGQYISELIFNTRIQNAYDENRMEYQDVWLTLSRMELEGFGGFSLDYEFYEILDGGYNHNYFTGEYDEWGNEIWANEAITELPEGLSYDLTTNTLTLENYHGESIQFTYRNYDWENDVEWFNLPTDTLTIELIGENSLVSDRGCAADFGGDLNVRFVGDGSLHLKSTNSMDQRDWAGYPYSFHTLWIQGGSLRFEDSVNVTVEIAGEALMAYNGETWYGEAPAKLTALGTDWAEIYIQDNATLTTKVPEGGKSNGVTLPEDHEYAIMGDRNPGGYTGIQGFSKLDVSGGTLNTSDLHLWNYEDENGELHSAALFLSGGTVNINALGFYATMEDWQWNEETQEDEFLGSCEALHYSGINADMGVLLYITGGQLNIDVDPSEHPDEIRANFNGMNLQGADLILAGGEINLIPGYDGCMLRLQSLDYNEDIYYFSSLHMTGGKLNLNGKDDCRVVAIETDNRSEVKFLGGILEADHADLRVNGKLTFGGATFTGSDLDIYPNEQLKITGGTVDLSNNISWQIGMGEMSGGILNLSEAVVDVFGGFGFNGGQINITNVGEEIFWPGLQVHTYFSMNGEAELNLVQNAAAPAMVIGGTFHQMDDTVVNIEFANAAEDWIPAVHVADGWHDENSHGTMLLNSGAFRIESLDENRIQGLHVDDNSVVELAEGRLSLTNADAHLGGETVILAGTFQLDNGCVTMCDGGTLVVEDGRFLMDASMEKDPEDQEWYIAFLAGSNSKVTVNGGIVEIRTSGYDCAVDLCGDYLQTGGEVSVSGDNMAMAVKGVSEIQGGVLNLTGMTGYTQNYVPEITENCKLTVSGGTVNIDAEMCGMELGGAAEFAGGEVNIEATGVSVLGKSGHSDESGQILVARGILIIGGAGGTGTLTVSGGNHSITVPDTYDGYVDGGLQAILASESQVAITGGELEIHSFHGIMTVHTEAGQRILLGEQMAAYSLESGQQLMPLEYEFCVDEMGNPADQEQFYLRYYYCTFEEDNEPGDFYTEVGVDWAGDLMICAEKAGIKSLESDTEQLLPGKKATLTAVTDDPSMKLSWSLAEGDKNYATLTVGKNNTATLTAKKNKEARDVTVIVSVKGSDAPARSLTIRVIPVVSEVVIRPAGEEILNNQTILFLMDDQDDSNNVMPLYVTCLPVECSNIVTWKSSDPKSAYVNESDELVVLKPGKTVTITATATDGSGKKASFKVQTALPVKSIELTGSEVCAVGMTVTLKAAVYPATATYKTVDWKIVDGEDLVTKNAIASISGGKLKGLAPGEVTVRASSVKQPDVYAEWTVTVRAAVKSVQILDENGDDISKKTVTLEMSSDPAAENALQLTAVNLPDGSGQEVIWKSSNPKFATVDENGLVTALVAGKTVTVTATATDGTKKNTKVTVKTVQPMEDVTLSGSEVAAADKTVTLKADIYPANTTNKKLVWYIVDGDKLVTKNALASISGGKLKVNKGVQDGDQVTVRVAWAEDPENVYDEWDVTLYATAATKVLIRNAEGDVITKQQTLVMSYGQENTMDLFAEVQKESAAQVVTWKSSNEKYATVDEYGVVTVLVPGKVATITATAADGSGKKATVKIKGIQPVEELTGKEGAVLDADGNLFVAGGKTLKLASYVEILPASASNKGLKWYILEDGEPVTKTAQASISTSGVLTAKKVTEPVTLEILAEAKDGYGANISFFVTVYPATTKVAIKLWDVDVTGKTLSAEVGTPITLVAQGTPELTADMYTWKSSSTKYATVDSEGNVELLEAGVGKTVTVTATAADGSGKKATVKFKIEERTDDFEGGYDGSEVTVTFYNTMGTGL